ncbi:MAG: flagellin lysine-N-methylase [Clostridium sp.]|uniref:flagellin lysine-N-methylase n=1 Tax=Clostridium sp. TaxID=1506 RepID=UPI003F2DB464
MKIRIPYYFNDFSCIAGDCESTCCANWEVVIDDESFKKYKNIETDFKDVLKSNLTKNSEGENIFLLKEDRCSFLNKDNTCNLYINLGKDSLCYTCSKYPRFIEDFLDLREMGLSLSCPEACRIIIKEDSPIKFNIEDNNEKFIGNPSDFDKDFLSSLLQSRDLIFQILDDNTLLFKEKITIIFEFASALQNKIDLDAIDEPPLIINESSSFSKYGFSKECLNNLKKEVLSGSNSTTYDEILSYFEVFKDFKTLNNDYSLKILASLDFIKKNKSLYLKKRSLFEDYFKERNYMFKNILVYFIFRYFLKSFFDFNSLNKIKLAVVNLIMIRELSIIYWIQNDSLTTAQFVKILYTFSKNIEHLEENISSMEEILSEKNNFNLANILNLIDFNI